jgi:hypothetical protein
MAAVRAVLVDHRLEVDPNGAPAANQLGVETIMDDDTLSLVSPDAETASLERPLVIPTTTITAGGQIEFGPDVRIYSISTVFRLRHSFTGVDVFGPTAFIATFLVVLRVFLIYGFPNAVLTFLTAQRNIQLSFHQLSL